MRSKINLSLIRDPSVRGWVHDVDQLGLVLYKGERQSTWYAAGRDLHGKYQRVKLGRADLIDRGRAVAAARIALGEQEQGTHLAVASRETADEAFAAMMERRQDPLKRRQLGRRACEPTNSMWRNHAGPIKNLPLADLTTRQCEDLHAMLSRSSPSSANLFAAVLNSVRSFRQLPAVIRSSECNRLEKRKLTIAIESIWSSILAVDDADRRRLLQVGALTGIRLNSIAQARWEQYDSSERTYTVEFNKGTRAPYTFPLADATCDLFDKGDKSHPYIFPSGRSYIRSAVPKDAGWTFHDLRRAHSHAAVRAGLSEPQWMLLRGDSISGAKAGYAQGAEASLHEAANKIARIFNADGTRGMKTEVCYEFPKTDLGFQ